MHTDCRYRRNSSIYGTAYRIKVKIGKEEEEEEVYYSIQYNTKCNSKWNYNTFIPSRKAPWPGIQGGY